MPANLKNHGLNFLVKTAVVVGVAVIIYFMLTLSLLRQSTNLEKKDIEIPKASQQDTATSTDVSRDQLAAGLIAMHNTNISIPESLTLSQYEKLIGSSTLNKDDLEEEELNSVGPGFLARGGAGIVVYLPYLQGVLDDDGQSLVRVYIDSITNKLDKNILDSESPFETDSFFNKLKFEKISHYYKTERALHLKGDQLSIVDDVKQIKGSVVLNLPISISKYALSLDQIVTKSSVKAGNTTVSVAEVKEGALYLKTKSTSKSIIYVKCFNQNGEVIATSVITAIDPVDGFDKQSIISFSLSDQVDHLEIYAPSEVAIKKYKFAI